MKAARALNKNSKLSFRYILARASTISHDELVEYGLDEKLVKVISNDELEDANQKLMSASDFLWLCSGTVTLEAALLHKPYFLTYRSTNVNYFLYLYLRKIDMAGLANIISEKYIASEFLQHDATAKNFSAETEAMFTCEGKYTKKAKRIIDEFRNLSESLSSKETSLIVADRIAELCS